MFKYLLIFWFSWLHPFYVSVTNIEQSKDKKSLEISSRIFFDDLEVALKDELGVKLSLLDKKQELENTELLKKYFAKNFQVIINDEIVPYEFLGFNIESEAAWCFIEVKTPNTIKKVEVANSLLYKSFKEQTHIYHLEINGTKKSTKTNHPNIRTRFEF